METVCFSVNLRNRAITQYNGFDFSSLCQWNGRVIGSIPGVGICEIGEQHDDDNGVDIDAFGTLFANDIGYHGPKIVRSMVAHYESEEGGVSIAYEAKTGGRCEKPLPATTGPAGVQVNGRRDIQDVIFSFSFANQGGSDFTVHRLEATVVQRNIGLKRVR